LVHLQPFCRKPYPQELRLTAKSNYLAQWSDNRRNFRYFIYNAEVATWRSEKFSGFL